ncbi:50S ribosomal protein L29 [Candidatus Roizmanbacteria bacterium]|nr:50S ribosomal protein L29 [Candidatus Roizmanbacteria bacterium]
MSKKTKDMINKSVVELLKEATSAKEEIARLTVEAKVKPQKDTNMLLKKRKNLAVILTVINEKKQQEVLTKTKQ